VRQAAASCAAGAAQVEADTQINREVHTGGATIHTENSAPAGTPPQAGVIQAENAATPQTVPMESMPPVTPMPDGGPPQEGVILNGSEPPASVPPSNPTPQTVDLPSAGPIPGGTPSQEGVVLTGSKPPAPLPAAKAPQTVETPYNAILTDTIPSQDGVIITEGSQTIHAPQSSEVLASGADTTIQQGQADFTNCERQTETYSERTSQTSSTTASRERAQISHSHVGDAPRLSLRGMVFSKPLAARGGFANDVMGTVARGEVAGSITGDLAAQSLASYMGYPAISISPGEAARYSDVEIGRGRITGTETTPDGSSGLPFAMYHVGQHTAPTGDFSKIFTADGTQWYKQYAQDAVERKPYKAPDDTIACHERIIKKLPDPPRRKDRI